MSEKDPNKTANTGKEIKVGVAGYIALAVAILFFSGYLSSFKETMTWITAFDFSTLTGKFGSMSKPTANFMGIGGVGARQGFTFSMTLVPAIMLALGVLEVFEQLGALRAAQKLLTPLLKPLLGVPGVSALIFVTGLQSTDAASLITKQSVEEGMISNSERLIIVSWLFAACGLMVNYFGSGPALFDKLTTPVVVPLMVIIVAKFIGSMVIRLLINMNIIKVEEGESNEG